MAYLNDNLDRNSEIIITNDTQKKLLNLINNVKPLRSHLDFKLGMIFDGSLFYQTKFLVQNYLEFSLQTKLSKFNTGLTIIAFIKVITYQEING